MTAPTYLTSFHGRDREVSLLQEHIASGERAIFVLGPAGVGKTRLVAHATSELNALWVDFGDVETHEQATRALAQALGLQEPLRADALADRVGFALASVERLIVSDASRCASELGTWLKPWLVDAPQLCAIVTSGVAPTLEGATHVRLSPLALPASSGFEEMSRSPAVSLFLDRARRMRPELELGPETTDDLYALVCALDGVPLELELLAAWMGLLDLSELRKRWASVLSSEPALGDALAWSWAQLSEDERAALVHVCVWRGGAPLEFVLEACDAPEALVALRTLEARSLISTQDATLSVLGSVREFVMRRASGPLRARAREAALGAIGRRARALSSAVLRLFPAEDVALAYACAPTIETYVDVLSGADAHASVELLTQVWLRKGRCEDVEALAERAPQWFEAPEMSVVRAWAAQWLGMYERAWRLASQAFDAEPETRVLATEVASMASLYLSRVERALEVLEVAPEHARALAQRARVAQISGRTKEALTYHERALLAAAEARDEHTQSRSLHNMAVLFMDQGRVEEAKVHLERTIELHVRHGERHLLANARNSLGIAWMRIGHTERARQELRRAMELFAALGMPVMKAMAEINLGINALDVGDVEEGQMWAARAFANVQGHDDGYVRGSACLTLAYARWFMGDMAEAFGWVERANQSFEFGRHIQLVLGVLSAEGAMAACAGDLARAEACFARLDEERAGAHEVLLEQVIRLHRAQLTAARRRAHLESGERDRARALGCELVEEVCRQTPSMEGVRMARLLLERSFDDALVDMVQMTRDEPEALLVGDGALAFRPPAGTWAELGRSPTLQRLFEALVSARLERPGVPMALEALQAAVWPGEVIAPRAAYNRIHVSMSKLRKLGLDPILVRREEGYLFDESVKVVLQAL